MSLMTMFKGFIGEVFGSLAHKIMLARSIYHELNNATIPTPDGTTQVDHVLVARYGIFVIEAKNMIGWILGNEKSAEWTQCFPGGKFRFQNPLNYLPVFNQDEILITAAPYQSILRTCAKIRAVR